MQTAGVECDHRLGERGVQVGTMHVIERLAVFLPTLVLRQIDERCTRLEMPDLPRGRRVADSCEHFAEPEEVECLSCIRRDAEAGTDFTETADLLEQGHALAGT